MKGYCIDRWIVNVDFLPVECQCHHFLQPTVLLPPDLWQIQRERQRGRYRGRRNEWIRETKFGSWQLMDGLQTALVTLDSMITCHFSLPLGLSLRLLTSSVSLHLLLSFFSREEISLFPFCHLGSESTNSCSYMKACIFLCFLNIYLRNVLFFFLQPKET